MKGDEREPSPKPSGGSCGASAPSLVGEYHLEQFDLQGK
jgi:hypothetical protein